MLVKAIQNFVAPSIPDGTAGQVYQVPDDFGQHLVEIGVAVAVKMQPEAPEKKPEAAPPSSASQAAPVSQPTTAKRRGGRPRKSSQSTTAGE